MNVKRMRGVNRQYLQSYLDEYCWRFNTGCKRFDCFDEICGAIGRNWVPIDNENALTDRFRNLAFNRVNEEVFYDCDDDDNFKVPDLPDEVVAEADTVDAFEPSVEEQELVSTSTPQRIRIRNNLIVECNTTVPDHPHVNEVINKIKSPKRGRPKKNSQVLNKNSEQEDNSLSSYNLRSRDKK